MNSKPLHIETPLLQSSKLRSSASRSVWLKLEALQPPGSFKIRGVGHACEEYRRRGAVRLLASSGGNAGIAVAFAGRELSLPVIVVVPQSTTDRAKELMRREGAEVIVHGASWQEAHTFALSLLTPTDAFIHPFDDPLLWEGHATLIDEVARAGLRPDATILSVGGGGLFCGVVAGLQRNGLDRVPIVAVETQGADSFAQSVRAGRLVTLPAITSIATSLGARRVCAQALQLAARHPVVNLVVSDRSALRACERFLDDHRLLVEPACGAALAVLYDGAPELEAYRSLLVIVCGGVTASIEQIQGWSARLRETHPR